MFRQLHARSLKGTLQIPIAGIFHKLISGDKDIFMFDLINYYAGLQFRNFDDLNNGDAVNMDITNHFLRERGYDVPCFTTEGRQRLVKISRGYDLTLYEYFASDIAGHTADFAKLRKVVNKLDTFLGSVAESIDPEKELVLVTSDHGNLENMNVKIHTNNPVPALAVGRSSKVV